MRINSRSIRRQIARQDVKIKANSQVGATDELKHSLGLTLIRRKPNLDNRTCDVATSLRWQDGYANKSVIVKIEVTEPRGYGFRGVNGSRLIFRLSDKIVVHHFHWLRP